MVKTWEEVGPQVWYFFDKSTQMTMIRVQLVGAGGGGRGEPRKFHILPFPCKELITIGVRSKFHKQGPKTLVPEAVTKWSC